MDDAYELGSERLIEAIGRLDVLNIFFPRLAHSLILDARHNPAVPPAILVDGMVGSLEARLRSFGRLRPQLPLPEELAVAPWFGSPQALVRTGIYDAIVNRWRMLGHPEGEAEAARALRQLVRLERAAVRDLLAGTSGKTLWQRPR
ncbi:MAG: hypothetical protein M3Q65_17335 [Chloroflexota bacterium]|nr:hypothetical protein [Chloroflexota bacterium]